jgi:hypothetical protein
VILGPHTPFSFVSLNKAQTLAQHWMGTADANVLAHPEEFEDSVVQAAKVRGTLGFPYKVAWVFTSCRTLAYFSGRKNPLLRTVVTIHRFHSMQECERTDACVKSHLECMMAWPTVQERTFAAVVKNQAGRLAEVSLQEAKTAAAVYSTWTTATADVNKV